MCEWDLIKDSRGGLIRIKVEDCGSSSCPSSVNYRGYRRQDENTLPFQNEVSFGVSRSWPPLDLRSGSSFAPIGFINVKCSTK